MKTRIKIIETNGGQTDYIPQQKNYFMNVSPLTIFSYPFMVPIWLTHLIIGFFYQELFWHGLNHKQISCVDAGPLFFKDGVIVYSKIEDAKKLIDQYIFQTEKRKEQEKIEKERDKKYSYNAKIKKITKIKYP